MSHFESWSPCVPPRNHKCYHKVLSQSGENGKIISTLAEVYSICADSMVGPYSSSHFYLLSQIQYSGLTLM